MKFKKQHHRPILALLLLGLAGRLFAQDYQAGVIYLKIADTSNVEITFPPPTNFSGDVALIYQIFDDYDVTEVEKPFAVLATTRLERIYRVYFDDSNDVSAFISDLDTLDVVEYAEQVPLMKLLSTVPNDPLISQQSYLDLIRAFDAFDLHQGGNATVAIVDDGVLTTHEDLADNIVAGWDVADNDNDPNPPFSGNHPASPSQFSHGTTVAGVAGAVTNNDIGIASIGWNNHIMPVKCVRDDADYPSNITHGYNGVAWAAANGADVINVSWGSTLFAQSDYEVIFAARNAGAIIVAAAGNENTIQPLYPAAYGEGTTGESWEVDDRLLVVAVASVDSDGSRSIWENAGTSGSSASNFGQWVDISSYGTAIYSTAAGSSGGGAYK